MTLFDRIAPAYGLFYSFQKKYYDNILNNVEKEVDLSTLTSILDVGCGTGALCSVLHKRGFEVTGLDPSQKMLNVAMGKSENATIPFVRPSDKTKLPFSDKSFDVSIASYVAHGLKGHERINLYKEMSRITKHLVIIHDYNTNRAFLTNVVEWLEGGDYFNFIKQATQEMEEIFCDVREIPVSKRAHWYVCKKNKNRID